MPRRLFKIVSNSLSREPSRQPTTYTFSLEDVVWAMGSFCALNRKPFDAELLAKQFPPPYTSDSFIHAARALGFRIKRRDGDGTLLSSLNLPCLIVLNEAEPIRQANAEHKDSQPAQHTETEQSGATHIKSTPLTIRLLQSSRTRQGWRPASRQ